ncbi:MAG TPA: acyl-CoA dehydrogenase family protein, partial [Novosphingobium sp.]|nr:acyl-CoA dehydrogenase family protein [Novosphingobium sp.]
MHFDFSEDQRRLQDELRRMLGAISTPAEVRRVLEGTACHSAASWRALADIGALGLALPEALGGAGMGRLELCLLAEEAGRALAAVPLLGTTYLAAELLLHAASPALQAQYLPRIAAGTAILTAAIDQHGQHAGPTPAPLLAAHTLTAQLDAVADGMLAEAIIVLAGDALVLV